MKTIAKHLVPNAGTLIIVGLLFLVQSVGALPGATSAEPLAPSQALISYQGTLTDSSGNPINGTVSMEFSLYDGATGGNRMWGPETQTVQVSNGLFHTLLGSVTPIDLTGVTSTRYLDIEVDGEALSPREILTSVPFAVEASRVSAPLDVQGWITSRGSGGGVLSAQNPNNEAAGVNLSWADNVARIRVGGSGDGSRSGFDIQAIGNRSLLRVFDDGSIQTGGGVTSPGSISARNPDNVAAGVDLSWLDDVARIRIGGSGDGSRNGLDIQTVGNRSLLRVYDNGNLRVAGSVTCGAVVESNLQTEEEPTSARIERFEEGDVLCWGIDQLELCSSPNDRLVQAVADPSGQPIVLGAEVIKAIGPVRRGDILVASDVPGYAMVNNSPILGSVIAQALEGFDGAQGIIKAMIRKW